MRTTHESRDRPHSSFQHLGAVDDAGASPGNTATIRCCATSGRQIIASVKGSSPKDGCVPVTPSLSQPRTRTTVHYHAPITGSERVLQRPYYGHTGQCKAGHAEFLKIVFNRCARPVLRRSAGRSASIIAVGNEWTTHGLTEEEVERRDAD